MPLTKEDIIHAVAEMSVKDVVELIEAMEEKFGVLLLQQLQPVRLLLKQLKRKTLLT